MNIGAAQDWARRCRSAEWGRRLQELATGMTDAHRAGGRLLLVGNADDSPWHLAAHLDQLHRYRGEGMPTGLLDHGAANSVGRRDVVLALGEDGFDDPVLDRLDALHSSGVPVFGMTGEAGAVGLASVADDAVALPAWLPSPDGLLVADFEVASHVLGVDLTSPSRRRFLPTTRGWRRAVGS